MSLPVVLTSVPAIYHRLGGKSLDDKAVISSLDLNRGRVLYLRDLGPQIGWKTVFLAEYAGPLFAYMITFFRPSIIYGDNANLPMSYAVK